MFNLLITKAFAQTVKLDTPERIYNWLEKILDWGFLFFAIIAVGALLYAAFNFLFSGGDDKKITSARTLLLYAFLAIILAAVARTIPILLRNILNI